MIARDEENFIADCLRSAREIVDEIVVVDTGSSDSTSSIATDFGARVFPFEWNDDFGEARNFSLDNAGGDWILILDADETIAARDANKIRALPHRGADGYIFTYRNYSQQSQDTRWIANDGSYDEGNGWDGWIPGRVVRMFRRDERIRFQGAVHEIVDPSILAFGGTIAEADIIVHHFHEKKGKATQREKQLNYLRMCEKNLEKFPGNPKTYYDMGLIYRFALNDLPEAIACQQQALQLDPDYEDARMALAFACHLNGNTMATARELTTLLGSNPRHAPALTLCGIILEKRGKLDRAVESYRLAISINPNLVDARVNLGDVLLRKGDAKAARSELETAYQISPSNHRALLNLGALELSEGKHQRAQHFFESALKQSPDSAPLWNNLGVLYAEMGRKAESIQAFEKALELDPTFEHARRNLKLNRAGTAV